jgi:hypothetical protein
MFPTKSFSIFIILFCIISLIVIATLPRIKRQQKTTKEALDEGFGYYSEEYSLGCFSKDGKCTTEAIETTVQHCKPHPYTGRGCIDENGLMSYKTINRKKPCRPQCFSSKFVLQNGIQVLNPTIDYVGTSFNHQLTANGCNKIVDKNFGIDYTDYFLGDFVGNSYELNNCIPNGEDSNFQGYYQQTWNCTQQDQVGSNTCQITCGGYNQNRLNINSMASARGSQELLTYFPKEINEEGQIRFVCYDINNKDQIELLNYSDEVPENFVYPNKCYKHSNVLNFNENIWPAPGVSNLFKLTANQVSQNVSYIDILPHQYDNFNYITHENTGILSGDYDISKNPESYVKLRFGNEIALLDKIFPVTYSGVCVRKANNKSFFKERTNNLESRIFYVAVSNGPPDTSTGNIATLSGQLKGGIDKNENFKFTEDPHEKIFGVNGTEEDNFYTKNQHIYNEEYYFIDKDNEHLYFPVNLWDIFEEQTYSNSITVYNGVSTFVQIEEPSLDWVAGDIYAYMISKIPGTEETKGIYSKGIYNNADSTIAFGGSIFNYSSSIDYLFVEQDRFKLQHETDTTFVIRYEPPQPAPSGQQYYMDFSRSFMTFNAFTKRFMEESPAYNYLQIKDNSMLDSENLSNYSINAMPDINKVPGYYGPLSLKGGAGKTKVNFIELPKINFYVPSDQEPDNYKMTQPSFYKNTPLVYFNEETLTSCANYSKSYIEIGNKKKYFLSDLDTINHGKDYYLDDYKYKIFPLYSTGGVSGNLDLELSLSNIEGVSPLAAVTYRGKVGDYESSRQLRIIRGNSEIVQNINTYFFTFNEKQEKLRTYFEMIRNQDFKKFQGEDLIIEPEKSVTLLADYEVFKSPYSINFDNSKNFYCFDETGRPLDNGTTIELDIDDQIFYNIRCPNNDESVNYQITNEISPYCAQKGVAINKGTSLGYCVQYRDEVETNFRDSRETCVLSRDDKIYNTLKNQFEEGLQLRPVRKAIDFMEPLDDDLPTKPSYFTKLFKEGKLYQPGEEFFIEKLTNNYYISLVANNTNFVTNADFWKRIFIYEDNILTQPGQNFFNTFPKSIVPNEINSGLGKFPETYQNLNEITSYDLYLAFNTSQLGLTTQNFLNQGIGSYAGSQLKAFAKSGITKTASGDFDSDYNENVQYHSYIGILENALVRKRYLNPTFTNIPPDPVVPGVGTTPEWENIKLEPAGNGFQYSLHNPICATFRISKRIDKFVFVSRFYDSDLEIPWANNVEIGDYFNPDLIYFNSFFWSFIKSGSGNYGNFNGRNFDKKPVNVSELNDLFYPEDDGSIPNPFAPEYIIQNPIYAEVSDHILFLPPTLSRGGKDDYGGFNFPSFPISYPTFFIRRVIKIDKDQIQQRLTFEPIGDNVFHSSNINENSRFVMFNLGKNVGEKNLINRNFRILNLTNFTSTLDIIVSYSQDDVITYNYDLSKKYIEFEFEINSINQTIMSELYNKFLVDNNGGDILGREISLLQNPTTYLTPALSAKYIKNEVNVPSQTISGNTFLSLSNTSEQDILNTKVISQSTRIRSYNNNYYINEFRENSDFFTPQVDRTFSVGDTFDYYSSEQDIDSAIQGQKKFKNVLTLQVVEVDVTLVDGVLSNSYDYKCRVVEGEYINPFIDAYQEPWRSFFLYRKTIRNSDTDWEYQLPYTIYNGVVPTGKIIQRVTVNGVNSNFTINCKNANDDTTYGNVSKDNIFLDYYKFRQNKLEDKYLQGPKYGSDANAIYPTVETLKTTSLFQNARAFTSLKVSTPYSGSAIRAGLLDTMVLKSTRVQFSQGGLVDLNVSVLGKPYGTLYFLSSPETRPMINYGAFGKVINFSIDEPASIPASGIITTNKGFQIKVTTLPPNSYSFSSITSPYKDLTVFENSKNYHLYDIINFKNNIRQYYQNYSKFTLPYLTNPSIENGNIPFSVRNILGVWFYPLFLEINEERTEEINIEYSKGIEKTFYYAPGQIFLDKGGDNPTNYIRYGETNEESTEDKINYLKSFKPISRTIFPEDNFELYNTQAHYGDQALVVKQIEGTNTLFQSNFPNNIGNPVTGPCWSSVPIIGNLEEQNNFYPLLRKDSNYTNYIDDLKNLNNQNLPALIQTYEMETKPETKEFCPATCTFYDPAEDYSNTLLDSSYFEPIKYLFESPIILNEKDTPNIISLGNSPVELANSYQLNFLQNGGANPSSFLGQYMYFLDIRGEEKKFGKGGCSGNLMITKQEGFPTDTGVSKFTFANSLIFNFIPCDIEGQDYITYSVDIGASTGTSILIEALPEYTSTDTPNVFPPHGVSCNVIVSSEDGTCFRPVYGHFEHNYIIKDNHDLQNPMFLLDADFQLKVRRSNIAFNIGIEGSGCCYGDVWYNSSEGASINYSSGFIIPRLDGGVSSDSFIYLNKNFPEVGGLSTVVDRNIIGFDKTKAKVKINTYDIINTQENTVYTSKTYDSFQGGTTIFIQAHKGKLLTQKQSIFKTDSNIDKGEFLYLPSNDITENIKVKAYAIFGKNYLGEMVYNINDTDGIYNLKNEKLSPLVFKQNKNQLLNNDVISSSYPLFVGDGTDNIDNFENVFTINFKNDSFSIKPNFYRRPIKNRINEFLFNPTRTLDLSLELSSINTKSITTFVSKKMTNMVGLSIGIDFAEFLDYNLQYNGINGSQIPGKTNIQLQLDEIRQNVTNFNIERNNICSLYFEPDVGPELRRESTSTLELKQQSSGTYYSSYLRSNPGPRFYGKFLGSQTKLNLTPNATTVFLGCNLIYLIDQTDASNEYPIVFSNDRNVGTNFSKTDIDMGFTGDQKNQKFLIKYFLNEERVTYDEYNSKGNFGNVKSRFVEIIYRADFDQNKFTGAEIYFGFPVEGIGVGGGGMMKFNYH